MGKVKLTLIESGDVTEQLVINKDHMVTVKAYVDRNTDMKILEVTTVSSVIRIIFYGYQGGGEHLKKQIDLDVTRILNLILDESETNSDITLNSNFENTIRVTTTIRGV